VCWNNPIILLHAPAVCSQGTLMDLHPFVPAVIFARAAREPPAL